MQKTIDDEYEAERDYEMECLRVRTANTADLLNAIENLSDEVSEGVSVVKTFIYGIYLLIAGFTLASLNDHFHILQRISENI